MLFNRVIWLDFRNLANVEAHQRNRVADRKPRGTVKTGRVIELGDKPAAGLRSRINIISKTRQQQNRRQRDKPADGSFNAAQARAQFRGQIL